MKNPFLSIITINYSNLEGLNKTLSSVIEQMYRDIEYIIIDGGSDDGSLDLINENAVPKYSYKGLVKRIKHRI